MRCRALLVPLFGLATALGGSIIASPANASTSSTVTIGVSEMLTGGSALYGAAVLKGIEVATSQVNASGGVLGKKIKLEIKDDASDDAQATTIMRGFAQQSNIPVAIAPTYQSNFNAACAASNQFKIPSVAAQSGAPDAANDTKNYCYTLTVNPVAQVTATFKDLAKLGYHKLVMVYDNTNG